MVGWAGLVARKESSAEQRVDEESQSKPPLCLGRRLQHLFSISKHRHPKQHKEEEEETMSEALIIFPPSPRKWSITSSRLGVSVILLLAAAVFLVNLEAVYNPSSRGKLFLHSAWIDPPTAQRTYFNWSHFPDDTPLPHPALFPGRLGDEKQELFMCDRSHVRTDICYLKGDVRMDSRTSSFLLYARNESTPLGEERIKPYTRKWEKNSMDLVHELKLKSVRFTPSDSNASACDVVHSLPAVVFTTGGYTGNIYHEFHDGLIPLYITSQHLNREVVLIGVEFHNWWLTKYAQVTEQMSNYSIIDFDRDERVHCFPEVTVGLHIHDEMAIHPALMPNNESIVDFRNLLDRAYRPHPGELEQASMISDMINNATLLPPRPRLTIIVRNDTRVILNLDQVVETATEVGFEVNLVQPARTSELKKIYWALNSSHVMMGVHGAGMTHFLFMRPGTVFIQVIPLGTSWPASTYYGQPAKKLGLQYLGYEIQPEESSLLDKYDRNSDVLTNPDQVAKQGWDVVKQVYLDGQDVRLSLPRFRTTLLIAKAKAVKAMSKLDQRR